MVSSPLCHGSWTSNNELNHRRTVILFNELHSNDDGLPFTAWISPDAPGLDLWENPENDGIPLDDEATALTFVQRFVARIWQGVVSDLEKVIDECSKHIIFSVSPLPAADHLNPRHVYSSEYRSKRSSTRSTLIASKAWHTILGET